MEVGERWVRGAFCVRSLAKVHHHHHRHIMKGAQVLRPNFYWEQGEAGFGIWDVPSSEGLMKGWFGDISL